MFPLSMLEAYIEGALWSSVAYGDDETGTQDTPMDELEDTELSDSARATMRKDCEDFLTYLEERGIDWSAVDPEDMGRDFWLTRNRHGAGFWDRGLGDLGRQLTHAAHAFGSCDLVWDGDSTIDIA